MLTSNHSRLPLLVIMLLFSYMGYTQYLNIGTIELMPGTVNDMEQVFLKVQVENQTNTTLGLSLFQLQNEVHLREKGAKEWIPITLSLYPHDIASQFSGYSLQPHSDTTLYLGLITWEYYTDRQGIRKVRNLLIPGNAYELRLKIHSKDASSLSSNIYRKKISFIVTEEYNSKGISIIKELPSPFVIYHPWFAFELLRNDDDVDKYRTAFQTLAKLNENTHLAESARVAFLYDKIYTTARSKSKEDKQKLRIYYDQLSATITHPYLRNIVHALAGTVSHTTYPY